MKLFSPITLAGVTLKNRVVMASMHTGLEDLPFASARLKQFYVERVQGGVSLIITGGVSPNFNGRVSWIGSQLSYAFQKSKHKRITDAVHQAGGRIALQILHAGRYAFHSFSVSPSGRKSPITPYKTKEMSLSKIESTVRDFATTARLAHESGYDGIEVMGSEGYLLHQFFSEHTNQRSDSYGGSLEGRIRFCREVVKAIRAQVPQNFMILYRVPILDLIPSGGSSWSDVEALVRALEDAGVSAFTSGIGWHESRIPTILTRVPRAAFAQSIAELKKITKLPVLGTNRIPTPEVAEKLLIDGVCDAVAIGRPMLADPAWAKKAEAGESALITPCIACNQSCLDAIFVGKVASCLVNPRAAYETKIQSLPAKKRKSVLVVGGGAAGLAFAEIAAKRGHRVEIREKSAKLGGQLNLAMVVPGKAEFKTLLAYYQSSLSHLGVTVKLSHEVGARDFEGNHGFDAVVVASGVRPKQAPKLVRDDSRTVNYSQILSRSVSAEQSVGILGAGGVAVDTAEFLLSKDEVGTDPEVFRKHWGISPQSIGGLDSGGRKTQFQARKVYLLMRSLDPFGKNLGKTSGWVHRAELKLAGLEVHQGVREIKWQNDGLFIMKASQQGTETSLLLPIMQLIACVGSESVVPEVFAESDKFKLPVFRIGGAFSDQKLDAARAIREATLLADQIEDKL